MRLLYVEDNERLARNTCASLESNDFVVDWVATGADAVHSARSYSYDAIILDLGLPDMDGLSVLDGIKQGNADTPVIICTARDALDDRVKGLNAGSDDYLVKPFDSSELIARIRAVLRRPGGALGLKLSLGNIRFDTNDRSVEIAGQPARFSRRELDLLEVFMRRKGRILSKDSIENALYGFDAPPTPNAIEVAIHRLRKKLQDLGAASTVHTLRGIGYLMEDDGQ
ncbi:transcriptional regulator [Phaeobacter gallaeciensis]|uniref:Transcriptional regulator n=1 Tax=Phaeobacter gallaeciensis TaxID=60890 RepID=A0A1B0ZP17_9RHOB|nr:MULTISPECIES: response regulator transcription factor [Phaeobacter]MEE2634048.1 response regulator transcription factor [Pseudomonadota bacterium]ANP35890.1 transcriptional regulator [Phaeobacter gallaeciensis]MDE4062356.1 response regulator transcription factor [Phaeobacter gallaeciensis]MDE4125226.1 response regulator transcription factor [Phaeobacter gallaeciensis]MDE4129936.1 response regulator transcription factor [Phaeobacter gallaeciensis]